MVRTPHAVSGPPEGRTLHWKRRQGVLVPFFTKYFWGIRESGAFLFCTDALCWEEQNSIFGAPLMYQKLLRSLTFIALLVLSSVSTGQAEVRPDSPEEILGKMYQIL